ncbi:MAG: hypothetical protein K0Q73_4604, partial [Paenibacillus sp.]|nr:hypothetical protein [Paenibacillus sp.]
HLPPHIHFYIASRSDLNIPTTRLLVKGEIHHILIQDLRFERDEVLDFFRNSTDLLLTKEQVTELYDQTEGWVGGLRLAAISLQRSDNIAESIHQFRGHQHHISDYLLEEVLYHQPESIRAFLLETSILTRMNRSLCQAVTGQMNSQEQLERLEQLNLFIIPLDEGRNWYRYHHLLSEFLQQLWFRTDPDKWMQAHIRAANWLENHEFDEVAVEHYLEGKQSKDAIRLIEKNLHFFMKSKDAALKRWVSALPKDSFAEKPMIEMLYISTLIISGKWKDAFQRVYQAKDRFEAQQANLLDEDWKKVIGNIYFYCAIATILQKDYSRASDYFELAERYIPERSFLQTLWDNRYQCYGTFNDLLSYHDLRAAEPFFLKWIKAWEDKKQYPFVVYRYVLYSDLMYEWNRLDEAEFYISQVLECKDRQPFARLFHVAVSASRIHQAKGNPNRATELLVQLKSEMDSLDYHIFMPKIEAEFVFLSLRQGSLQNGLDWLQGCGLTHKDEVSLDLMAEHLALAKLLAACERTEEAMYLLERLYRLLGKEDRLRERIKVLIVQSVTLWRSGQTEAALVQLETALHLAEPEGYIRSFIDEGPKMAEMLSAYLKARRDSSTPSVSYVKQLLQALNVTLDEDRSPKEILTEQEFKILLLIADGLLNKEIAHSLNIKGDTVKFHIKNMYRKLGANNRAQALQQAKQLQILV